MMTATNNTTIVYYRLNGAPVFRRVYVDEHGSLYVKMDGRFVCIDGTRSAELVRERV